jgi:hypothetical protein
MCHPPMVASMCHSGPVRTQRAGTPAQKVRTGPPFESPLLRAAAEVVAGGTGGCSDRAGACYVYGSIGGSPCCASWFGLGWTNEQNRK